MSYILSINAYQEDISMEHNVKRAPRRPLSELNVIDNFLFTTIMNDPEHRIESRKWTARKRKYLNSNAFCAGNIYTAPQEKNYGIHVNKLYRNADIIDIMYYIFVSSL